MEKTDLKAQLAEVAQRIRTMREITGLSEDEMAKCTGTSREEYQRCEAGEQDFSFTFIYKCAKRFGVDPTDLIRGVSPTLSTYTIVRHGDGLPITRRHGFKYLNLAPLFKNKTAEPFFVTMPYSEAEQHVAIKLASPMLLLSMLVGVVVAIFQAVTQIHEQTLTFIFKVTMIIIVLLVAGGWMMETLLEYAETLFETMRGLGG